MDLNLLRLPLKPGIGIKDLIVRDCVCTLCGNAFTKDDLEAPSFIATDRLKYKLICKDCVKIKETLDNL
jgi:hypothetical protein